MPMPISSAAAVVKILKIDPAPSPTSENGLRLHGLAGVAVQAVGAVAGHREHPVRRPGPAAITLITLATPSTVGVANWSMRGLDRVLHVRVERGADQVAALGDLLLADAGAARYSST